MAYGKDDAYRWLAMYNDGMSIEEIHLETGVATGTINTHLKKLPEYTPRSGRPASYNRIGLRGKQGSRIPHARITNTRGHRRRGNL